MRESMVRVQYGIIDTYHKLSEVRQYTYIAADNDNNVIRNQKRVCLNKEAIPRLYQTG